MSPHENPTPVEDPYEDPIAVAVPVQAAEDPGTYEPPILPTDEASVTSSDAANEALAAEARAQGEALIRDHLRSHLSQNPCSSFVTWIATLHPENATVSIDPRFFKPGNPWLTVYTEVENDVLEGTVVSSVEGEGEDHREEGAEDENSSRNKSYGGLMDLVMGFALVLTAVGFAFSVEVLAAYVYISEALCCKITETCSPVRICTALPFSISWILSKMFRLADAFLLLSSVMMVELVAAANFFVCSLLALNCDVGRSKHQMTRRYAHLTRWAFRRIFDDWTPQRVFIQCGVSEW
eukprot:CAMPEP_0183307990 /NCGR_PEP_ID=MMETSP0160_2-20130417/19681_1 /TAXON_ID=2839 ORGANISM="Odontella Sinensis, Strain Grunow 1884" /NCGR_SAMPLE_ID=MMETSP0160_2 /ASSEMBLY_ACC=CAM_ASM_000250 /LENGTH=293 /DNA_ID=CAMNT_0025471725 /DNA_START=39 /DNA_END=917 /DNA_ORIENTATION=+